VHRKLAGHYWTLSEIFHGIVNLRARAGQSFAQILNRLVLGASFLQVKAQQFLVQPE